MGQEWKRELFLRSYDWKRLPFLGAFLGNGRIGAFFDRTGVGPQDYFYCKSIREEGYLAGLFWTYVSVDMTLEHENRGWQQSLDMYHGVLETRYGHPTHPAGRSVKLETFIAQDKNVIVFHCEPPYRDHLPVNLGVSFSSRGGSFARQLDREYQVSSSLLATVPFRVISDPRSRVIQPVPESPGQDKKLTERTRKDSQKEVQDPFRLVELNCSVTMMCEGEATLTRVGDNLEAEVTGPATIYLSFDAKEGERPSSDKAIIDVGQKGYAQVRKEHELLWEDFWGKSYLESPYSAIDRLYVSSLYYIRCDVGGIGRHTSCSCPFPLNGWKSSYGWDDAHMHQALLSSNHPDMTDIMMNHWDQFRKNGLGAKLLAARDPQAEGILLDYFGFEPEFCRDDAPIEWYRNNEWWAPTIGIVGTLSAGLSAWRQFSYTGERKYLEKYYPLIRGIALMLKTFALQPHGDRLWIRVSQQSDESYGYGGTANPMAITATAKAFLKNAALASAEMAEPELAEDFRNLSEKVELPNNGWVYLPFAGTEDASSDALLTFFPAMMVEDMKMAGRTLDYYKGRCMGVMGGVDAQAWVKDRAVFPWTHFRALMGEAMLGRHQQAVDLLDQALRHNCYEWDWGLLPELIHRNGCPNIPLLSPHGMFVSAVNAMYLQEEDGVVRMFAGVSDEWLKGHLGFQLRTSPGALISARWLPDRGMEIGMQSSKEIVLLIRKPGFVTKMMLGKEALSETDGFCRLEIPAGVKSYSISTCRDHKMYC